MVRLYSIPGMGIVDDGFMMSLCDAHAERSLCIIANGIPTDSECELCEIEQETAEDTAPRSYSGGVAGALNREAASGNQVVNAVLAQSGEPVLRKEQ